MYGEPTLKWRDYQEALADGTDHWCARRYKSLALNVLRYLPHVEGRCLDVGCGEGLIADTLKRHRPGLTVCGTDISHVRLVRAAARVGGVGFVVGDILSLPWEDGSFDVVVCCEVLEHLPEQEPALEEMFRILKNNGLLLVTVLDRQKVSWSICPKCASRVYKDGHLRSFSPENLRHLIAPWGEILTLSPVGKRWRQLKRKVVASLIPGREYRGKFLLCLARKR